LSRIDLEKDLPFLSNSQVLYSGKLTPYKAPMVLIIFFTAILVLSLDMCFLGIGIISAVFKEIRWLAIVLFIIKILVDIITFASWFAVVKDRADRAKYSCLYITEESVVIATKRDEEISYCSLDKNLCTFSIKASLIAKFCGVFALNITSQETKKTCYLLKETELEKINLILFN